MNATERFSTILGLGIAVSPARIRGSESRCSERLNRVLANISDISARIRCSERAGRRTPKEGLLLTRTALPRVGRGGRSRRRLAPTCPPPPPPPPPPHPNGRGEGAPSGVPPPSPPPARGAGGGGEGKRRRDGGGGGRGGGGRRGGPSPHPAGGVSTTTSAPHTGGGGGGGPVPAHPTPPPPPPRRTPSRLTFWFPVSKKHPRHTTSVADTPPEHPSCCESAA